MGMVFMQFGVVPGNQYGTGYVMPQVKYPVQPEKITELNDVETVFIENERAYPIKVIAKVLEFEVSCKCGDIIFIKDGADQILEKKGNPDIIYKAGVIYATNKLIYELFEVNVRYFENNKVLEIFK